MNVSPLIAVALPLSLLLLTTAAGCARQDFPTRKPAEVLVLRDPPSEFECFCEDALPITGFICTSCDYHDKWGCQCWYIKAESKRVSAFTEPASLRWSVDGRQTQDRGRSCMAAIPN